MSPKISVLMPVYNGQTYIREAIESILRQSFKDFEFLIINDGGTDESENIIKSYKDPRILLLKNIKNLGLIKSLNIGLIEARGEYIARMDQDDISTPNRLAEQVAFMDAHSDIRVCGTWIKTIGEQEGFVQRYLTDSEDIRANLLFNTSLAHSSVMMRKSVLNLNELRYDEENAHFEDYALWVKVSERSKLANIPEVLLLYRQHRASISHVYRPEQTKGASRIRQDQLEKLGLHPSEEDMYIHNSLRPGKGKSMSEFIKKEEMWLTKIIDANRQTHLYAHDSLAKIIYTRWRTVCGMNAEGGLPVWKAFVRSPLSYDYKQKRMLDSLKIFVKCLVRMQ